MPLDNLYTSDDARAKLMQGINKVANAVGATMGTGGSNAIIEVIENPGHLLTNDGYTIANAIHLADPIEDMGRKILLESINRANKASGDGSSTTCVLTAAIIREGSQRLKDASPLEIKKSLEECVAFIEESIHEQTRAVVDESGVIDMNLLEQVATISAEDEEIGKTIANIYGQIGPKGIIHWDVSKTADDSYTIGQGITIEDSGYFSPYMCDVADDGKSKNSIHIKNPHILVTKQKVITASDLNQVASSLNNIKVKDLVVFASDVDPLVVPDLLKTRFTKGFRIVIVKMPILWRDQWFEDLSVATGARVVDPIAGFSLHQVAVADLGIVDDIFITKDTVYLDGIADVSEHVAELEAEGSDDSKLRASRLNTKTARYYVGAPSESALTYRRLKVEDAISAAYHALQGGVVAGGGVALNNASMVLTDSIGSTILAASLSAPLQQILSNAGMEIIKGEVPSTPTTGFDVSTEQEVDMFEAGIVDPAPIVLNAMRQAVSVAATVLTANTVVTFPRIDNPPQMSPYQIVSQ